MAAVLEQKPDPAAKFSSQVDEQIAQATSRIRTHDLILGGLTLASMTAVYAVTMILLDKSLNLSEGVRRLSLLGFLGGFAVVAYLLVVRPLRSRINPLYAAARVEETIEDAKNSITGYVDAQERGDVHGAVKAAISAKAAKAAGEADVNRAVDHRNLIIAGGVLVVFLVTLAVLFFVFRPTQFKSLLGRTFVPFSSAPIATRTQITLVKPEPPEPTLTTGQTITVVVNVGGKVPPKTDPARVRLLLRHNPADPNYEELPMQEGDTSRDWVLKVPEYLVQNGFWYKVAAGDAETQEYKVTVRSLPLFTDFEVSYDYPKYTRKPADKSTDANIRAYRGTKVVLLARTNREVKDGLMKFEAPGLPAVTGKPAGRPDTLGFTFTATEATRYRLSMTTATGERGADAPPFTITLDSDSPPTVVVTKPEEPETTAPANGQLSVDGTVGDDFGIDKVRLRLRADGRDLAPVPYEGGKSFRREKDGTWPNDLAYKGSVELPKLMYAEGVKFEPKEGMLVEYWLEAIDNCTETKPVAGWGEKPQPGQVGKSEPRKLRLTAPVVEPEDKKQLDDKRQQRKNEEKQHNNQQQQKFDNENREPNKPQDPQAQPPEKKDGDPEGGPKKDNPDPKAEPKDGKGDPQAGKGKNEPKKEEGKTEPKKNDANGGEKGGNDPNPPKKDNPENTPKNPDPKKEPGGMGNAGMTDPKTPPEGKVDPKNSEDKKGNDPPKAMNDTGTGGGTDPNAKPPEPAPMPKTPEQKKAEEDAKKVQEKLDENKGMGGDAKPNPNANAEKDRTEPAQQKPQPMNDPKGGGESQSKEGPKPNDPMNPMGGQQNAAESKPEGKLEQPTDPNAQPKPQPDEKKGNPAESREAPLGGTPGQDKPEPKKDATQPQPKGGEKEPNKDPQSGSTGKPPTEQKQGDPKPGPDQKPQNPGDKAGSAKPNVDPARGQDKNPGEQKPGSPPDPKPQPDPNAGTAKPEKSEPSAAQKPAQKDDGKGSKQPDASVTKPQPKEPADPKNPMPGEGASEAKPDNAQPKEKEPKGNMPPGKGEDRGVERGEDKPDPKRDMNQRGGAPMPKEKDQTGGEPKDGKGPAGGDKKLDEKQLKELEQAAKDLNNPDQKKREDAQKKLDKAIGEDKRKELEQTAKDLQSPDEATRKAAEKKVEDMKKLAEEQAKKDGKGGPDGKKEPGAKPEDQKLSPEDVADLAKRAQDLNSKDDKKRKDAEQEFDKKLGEDARKQLQEEMKNQPPTDPTDPKQQDDLKRKIEEQAKINPPGKGPKNDDWRPGGGANTDEPNPADPTDPRNKLKTAQLQLEEFEKNRYNKDLQDKLGWDQQKYDEFLKAQAERVKQYEKQVAELEAQARNRTEPTGEPTLKPGGGGKVENRLTELGSGATGGGATFAPPGFEDAKKRFQDAASKLQPKK